MRVVLRRPRGQPDGQGSAREHVTDPSADAVMDGEFLPLAGPIGRASAPSAGPEPAGSPKYSCMRITFLGHAGLFVETRHGSVLCDPWFTPAYFGSWFPFPRNDRLDPAEFGRPDFLYLSHLHRDHFDPEFLARHVAKDTRVLLPDFPTPFLEGALRDLGFTRFVRTHAGAPVEVDGLEVTIFAMTEPGRRAPRGLGAGARRRRDARAEPERRPAGRSRAAPGARSVRRALRAVLRRDLVPDRLRLPGRANAPASRATSA